MPFFPFFRSETPPRVELPAVTDRTPFVFGQPPIIIRVNDRIFALAEWYPAISIPVSNTTIEKNRENQYAFNTYRNIDDKLNNSPSVNW